MKIDEFERLINEVNKLPINNSKITFLEICDYSRRRFEEITSRVLKFFLQPNNEHELGDILLKSIWKLLNKAEREIPFGEVIVETEVFAKGKFLDILIRNEEFVIGIENKINAEVYNPLDIYGELIDSYKSKEKYKVVLSLRQLSQNEKIKLINHGFEEINYLYPLQSGLGINRMPSDCSEV